MSTTSATWERDDSGVVVLTLKQEDRPVVVLDSALLKDIDAALDEIGNDLTGFVLASGSRVFVAGANLEEIMSLDDGALDEYLTNGSRVYGRISSLKCPSVAAINGATLGGGLELAMHCDVLIALIPESRDPAKEARPYQIGLPEAGLRICPGWGGTNMLPARMDAGRAIRMTSDGRPFTVHEAAEAGLVHELVKGKQELIDRAKQIVLTASRRDSDEPVAISNSEDTAEVREGLERVREQLPDTESARAVVECVEAGLDGGWQAALACERANLIRLRSTDEGKAAIESFFAKSK